MKKLRFIIFFLIAVISFSTASLSAKEKKSVFIDRFEIHSPDKGDEFLIPGIESILKTKISSVGILKEKKEADYSIQGSIIIIGNSCITTASLKKGQDQILGFSKKGESKSAVIDHISEFSDKSIEILKIKSSKDSIKPQIQPLKEDKIAEQPKQEFHNKILFSSGLLDDEIKSIVPIDVDLDNKFEIALLGLKSVSICRIDNNELTTLSKKNIEKNLKTLTLEVLKDSNHKPHLIVNTYNQHRNKFHAKSFSFDKNFNFVKEKVFTNYFYRSFNHPKYKKTIIAKQGSITKDNLFYGSIKKLTFSDKYQLGDLNLNKEFEHFPTIYPVTMENDGLPGWIILKNDYLSLFTQSLDEIWRSSDKFGGSMKYIDIPTKGRNEIDERYFISQRLISTQDKNKKPMILCIKNNDSGKRLFQRVRFFTNGTIRGLIWNKIGIEEGFFSKTFQGWISDFALLDYNNDGTKEILLANPQRFSTFSKKSKTRVIVINFEK